MNASTRINVAIIGAGGYSGAELCDALLDHPHAEIVGLFGSGRRDKGDGITAPARYSEVFSRFRGRLDRPVLPTDLNAVVSTGARAVFLATPHEVSLELAPKLVGAGCVVLDLSGAFRLRDASLYPKHYGFEHTEPASLASAAYGLPEFNRAQIAKADLIACPGCYPTSAILALRPLVRAGVLDPARRPIIDSISGVSGAGRSVVVKSLFCEVSVQPYNVFTHRHNPEIDLHAGVATLFTPHLGPYDRGILSTIHADLKPGVDAAQIRAIYERAYSAERFIRLCNPGTWPSVADVRGTNFCDLAFAVDPAHRHAVVASAIDNLVKGAAGQAVQCFNIRFGFDEGAPYLPAPRRAPAEPRA